MSSRGPAIASTIVVIGPAAVLCPGHPPPATQPRRSPRYRQRHEGGNEEVEAMMAKHFRVPPANATTADGQQKVFDDYCWLTQLQQARCYETAITQWRRLKDVNYHSAGNWGGVGGGGLRLLLFKLGVKGGSHGQNSHLPPSPPPPSCLPQAH